MMLRLLLMIVIGHCAIYTSAIHEGVKTLHGSKETGSGKTLFFNAEDESSSEVHQRSRRDVPQPNKLTNSTPDIKVTTVIIFQVVFIA